ncbi:DUF397 domain-containing protein [Streptomyces acidiscabies]|uniref:DUF397 domain-containing protein n=1 Tax=Streptomyces acidiscabies TaxID=42234 RepID=UPI00073E58D6|nr:DUF397 domain-containing protein [Streptomyces acidiscabies]GAQ58385.1 hypothetical protein a10_08273 [Streptomyces acidiscabies]GAV45186.1 hypothetical protein Saa2_08171 [Streptomyces acidiscabies]
MRSVDLTNASWRKSSYSNSTGGDCLEVSDDLLSTADWRKSSYSNSTGGACLEFAPNLPSLVPVRDSKAPTLGALLFTAASWNTFVDSVK